mgnify:CR=1 FL=1
MVIFPYNRIITGNTGTTLEAESTLTYDGTNLDLGDGKYVRLGASNAVSYTHLRAHET